MQRRVFDTSLQHNIIALCNRCLSGSEVYNCKQWAVDLSHWISACACTMVCAARTIMRVLTMLSIDECSGIGYRMLIITADKINHATVHPERTGNASNLKAMT